MRPTIILEQRPEDFIDLKSEVRAGMLHGGEGSRMSLLEITIARYISLQALQGCMEAKDSICNVSMDVHCARKGCYFVIHSSE